MTDRQSLFAAGEFDAFARLRMFGGWEAFSSNLDPAPSPAGHTAPQNDGTRGYAGVRTPVGAGSSLALRVETGDRRSRVVDAGLTTVSDTGVMTAEWQTGIGPINGLTRLLPPQQRRIGQPRRKLHGRRRVRASVRDDQARVAALWEYRRDADARPRWQRQHVPATRWRRTDAAAPTQPVGTRGGHGQPECRRAERVRRPATVVQLRGERRDRAQHRDRLQRQRRSPCVAGHRRGFVDLAVQPAGHAQLPDRLGAAADFDPLVDGTPRRHRLDRGHGLHGLECEWPAGSG